MRLVRFLQLGAIVLAAAFVSSGVTANALTPGADLTVLNLSAVSGQTVTYTVTVTNIGDLTSTSPVTLVDTLYTAPSGSQFVSAGGPGSTPGWACTGPSNGPVAGAGPVTCTRPGTLAPSGILP